jgi:predicted transglutaminase-like cysteine proteinase
MGTNERASLERTLMQEQWANVLNLQPTATTAGNAQVSLPASAPPTAEGSAPVDLTGEIDLAGASAGASWNVTQAPAADNELEVVMPPQEPVADLVSPVSLNWVAPQAASANGLADPSALSASSQGAQFVALLQSPPAILGMPALSAIDGLVETRTDDFAALPASHTPALSEASSAGRLTGGAGPTPSGTEATVAQAAALHMTPLVWQALNGVNQSVNAKIRPMDDQQAFGVADYWTLPLSDGPRPVGNCKHYVLEKRKALVDAGFSPDVLSIAIVKTGRGEVHAVLIVGTDQGDFVMDNLTYEIKAWRDVRYTWIERQTPGKPLRWAGILMGDQASSS